MFKVCPDCDFEWHSKDGLDCPACNVDSLDEEKYYEGGAFGTGVNRGRLKNWYLAIGIITLVLLIEAFVLN